MMIMYFIFDLMVNELQNWFMAYQRWNWDETLACVNYTPLRGFPLFEWIRCFLWCSLETKCELILISFGYVNFIFVLSFLTVECLKKVVLITLEVDSLQIKFIVYGVETLKHFYYTYTILIRCFLSILCLRTSKILGWGELISVIF